MIGYCDAFQAEESDREGQAPFAVCASRKPMEDHFAGAGKMVDLSYGGRRS